MPRITDVIGDDSSTEALMRSALEEHGFDAGPAIQVDAKVAGQSSENAVGAASLTRDEFLLVHAIVADEWRAVAQAHDLEPGSITEGLVGRIIERLSGLVEN